MTRTALISIAAMGAISGSASAGLTETQTVGFDYDPTQGLINPVFDRFDTLGGTRQLDAVRFDFEHNFRLDFLAESTGPTAVAEGDWIFEGGFISILQLGLADDGGGDGEEGRLRGGSGGPPFFGPGAIFTPQISADLAASDGLDPLDGMGPDTYRDTFTDAYNNSWDYFRGGDQAVLDAMTGTGKLTTVFGGFVEIFFQWINDPGWPPAGPGFDPLNPTGAFVWAGFESARHNGSITVSYDYSIVPAPASAFALLGMGVFARRRR